MHVQDELKVYSVNFNMEQMKYDVETTTINNANIDILHDELCQLLDSTGYDIVDYNDEIAMVVDDNGFAKSLNPVFEVQCENGNSVQLAGKILFIRNEYNEYSVDFASIKSEDIFNLRIKLDIKLLGITR